MLVSLENKKFFYQEIVTFIFESIIKSNFLNNRNKKLDLGYIKWIYEKSPKYCQGITFEEDDFFRVIIEKEINDFDTELYIDSQITSDSYNFKIIYIRLYIPNLKSDFKFLKRQLINHIARKVHCLSLDPPFEVEKIQDESGHYNVLNNYIDSDRLLELNIGLRAESLYYNICFIKCIKDYLKFIKCDLTVFDKNIYCLRKEEYNIICKDIVNCFY